MKLSYIYTVYTGLKLIPLEVFTLGYTSKKVQHVENVILKICLMSFDVVAEILSASTEFTYRHDIIIHRTRKSDQKCSVRFFCLVLTSCALDLSLLFCMP